VTLLAGRESRVLVGLFVVLAVAYVIMLLGDLGERQNERDRQRADPDDGDRALQGWVRSGGRVHHATGEPHGPAPHTEGGSPYATVSQRSIAGTRTVEVRAVEHPGCEPLHLEAGDGPPLTAHQTGPGLLGEPEDPGESDRRTRRRRCPARPATEHLVDLGAVHGGRGVAFVAATS
jgi:hypothetical protein